MFKKILKYFKKNETCIQTSPGIADGSALKSINSVSSIVFASDSLPSSVLLKVTKQIDRSLKNVESGFKIQSEALGIKLSGVSNLLSREVADVRLTVDAVNAQLAAIRDYASNQQQQFQRFQDGYDLKILKDFALRVMRCAEMAEANLKQSGDIAKYTNDFEELRDELFFCLEGAGFGTWQPVPGSMYRGQEATVEVVGTTPALNQEDVGKIAEIKRKAFIYSPPTGSKVIRPAQVVVFNDLRNKEVENG